jgi:hypothetical protein
MMPEKESSKSTVQALASTGACLALGAIVSIFGLVSAVNHQGGDLIPWLGVLSVILIAVSSLCLFFALAAFLKRRNQEGRLTTHTVTAEGEYVAEYSRSNRVIALSLAAFFVALTVFFELRSAKPGALAISATFLGGAVWYAVHVMSTRVRFTSQGLVARLSWFRELNEPYHRVEHISGTPGTLKIQFSDGRTLRLHSGLGDPDSVIAHLHAHCPKSVSLG